MPQAYRLQKNHDCRMVREARLALTCFFVNFHAFFTSVGVRFRLLPPGFGPSGLRPAWPWFTPRDPGSSCGALNRSAGPWFVPRHPETIPLTLARTGEGVGAPPPPLRFFTDSEKTSALRAAGFWATLWGKPYAVFGENNLTGSGQVTELRRHKRNNLRQL